MSDADDRPLRRRPNRETASSAPPPLPEQPPLPDLDAISAALAAAGPEPPVAVPPAPAAVMSPAAPAASPAVPEAVAPPVTPPAPPVTPPAPPVPVGHVIEAPSDDVAAVPATSRVPGAAREGYSHLPTAPVVTATSGPVDGETSDWEPAPAPVPRAGVGPWALSLAIVALASSLFVGWMLPVALAAVVAAIVTLRRPAESRSLAVWSLVLGAVAMVYSAGWLLWAIPQLPTG